MTRRLATVLLLIGAGAAPLTSRASGDVRAGVMYSDARSFPVSGPSTSQPYLDIDLGLDASGVVASRDVVTYVLNARWTRIENDLSGASSTQNGPTISRCDFSTSAS